MSTLPGGKVAADLQQFFHVFADAYHDSGLGDHVWRQALWRERADSGVRS